METLTCQTCKQDWKREKRRGPKPKECPSCKDGTNHVCFCDRSFDTEHGLKIHQSRSHTEEEVENQEENKWSVYCDHGLCIICNKMHEHHPYCACSCHTDERYAKYRNE